MGQLENVQRGIVFVYFIYFLIFTLAQGIKIFYNQIDNPSAQKGSKYKEKSSSMKKKNLEIGKKDQAKNEDKNQKQQNTMQQLQTQKKSQPEQESSQGPGQKLAGVLQGVESHFRVYLPLLTPLAINVLTGSSYGFLYFWFFLTTGSYLVINNLKMHLNCVENKILKGLLQNLFLILTFFMWINLWATTADFMPYSVIRI